MKLALLLTLLYLIEVQSKSVKKNQNEVTTPLKTDEEFGKSAKIKVTRGRPPRITKPAIIAIEIVDANDNSTKSKNSKRTIESSLGYGYQPNYFGATNSIPRYQVYKYSQHNIPPYRGSTYSNGNRGGDSHVSVQKSVTYDLGSTRPEVVYDKPAQYFQQPALNQYYQPGTVLYSTVNQQGHLGGLTSNLPHAQGAVPVIFVRVLSSQLSNVGGALYPNLPKSHPYASLNSIDLQSLLSNHLTGVLNQYDYSNYNQQAQQQSTGQSYQPQAYQNYQYHQQSGYDSTDDLQTHENYPDDAHTRVIFHSRKRPLENVAPSVSTYQNGYLPVPESYINIAFDPPKDKQVYTSQIYDDKQTHQQNAQAPQYVYTPAPANEDAQGYYYENPHQQDYYSEDAQSQQVSGVQNYESQAQVEGGREYLPQDETGTNSAKSEALIDTQTVPLQPYNYHAHRVSRSKARKRNVSRRPVGVTKIKTESSDE